MNDLIETLFIMQQQGSRLPAAKLAAMRARVPAPVLAHYDRLTARGRKVVADVNHGVCSACHIRLPRAATLVQPGNHELRFCETCGAYLRFPEIGTEAPLPPAGRLSPAVSAA